MVDGDSVPPTVLVGSAKGWDCALIARVGRNRAP
jgi:hypothetical protein